jgi:cytochrome P450
MGREMIWKTQIPQKSYNYTRPTGALSHIPGRSGWPWLGSGLSVLKSPQHLLDDMAAEFGMVFRSQSFGIHGVMLLGPDANRFVLTDHPEDFSNFQGWYPAIGEIFPGGLMLRDFADHKAHRTLMRSVFSAQALQSYLPRVAMLVDTILDRWKARDQVLAYPEMKRIALLVAAAIFFDLEEDEINDVALPLLQELTRASTSIIRLDRFGTRYSRGLRARRALVTFLERKIGASGQSANGSTLLRDLKNGVVGDASLTTQEIVDHLIFMLVAAHDTTASAMATTLHFLASDQPLQERVRAEVVNVGTPEDAGALDRLQAIEGCIKESLRILPPLPTLPRRTTREIEYGGFAIPANTVVSVSPLHTHHMKELWSDPDAFDIDRFSSERAEHRRHSHMWIPFGSGPHICIGMQFAYLEAKIVIAQILSRFRISYRNPQPFNPVFYPFPYPSGGVNINIAPV